MEWERRAYMKQNYRLLRNYLTHITGIVSTVLGITMWSMYEPI
jgi:hypothetical protein